jgi:predicted amidohydrolase
MLKVAAIQYRALPSRKAENIRCLAGLIREAAENNARIIVLPEMCTTGLNIHKRVDAEILAETIPGPATDVFARLARHHKVYIVMGLAESDAVTGTLYNTQIILNSEGLLVGTYRKIHLFGPDLIWAETGTSGYQAVDTAWGKIALGICCDINYWEYIQFLSDNRVDIVAFSTNWVGDDLPFPYWLEMVAGRGLFVIAANNWGDEDDIHFSGGSAILAPDAAILSSSCSSANTIIYANITLRGHQSIIKQFTADLR